MILTHHTHIHKYRNSHHKAALESKSHFKHFDYGKILFGLYHLNPWKSLCGSTEANHVLGNKVIHECIFNYTFLFATLSNHIIQRIKNYLKKSFSCDKLWLGMIELDWRKKTQNATSIFPKNMPNLLTIWLCVEKMCEYQSTCQT